MYAAREYFDFFTPNNQTIFLTVKRNIKKLITVIHPKAIKGAFLSLTPKVRPGSLIYTCRLLETKSISNLSFIWEFPTPSLLGTSLT